MKFRKKPVVIEAHKLATYSIRSIARWCDGVIQWNDNPEMSSIDIPTLEGVMKASMGDWVIEGINGEFYPCKDDIFKATYEKVEE